MNQQLTRTTEDAIQAFGEAFRRGMEVIEEACAIYVSQIDTDSTAAARFATAFPEVPPGAWAGFEAVGRKWMDRRLLSVGGRLGTCMKRLPRSQQTAALDDGVDLLTPNGDTLHTSVFNLTPKQVRQVFSDHVRTSAEQKAWMVSEGLANSDPVPRSDPWVILGTKLRVREACDIEKKDIARILYELER